MRVRQHRVDPLKADHARALRRPERVASPGDDRHRRPPVTGEVAPDPFDLEGLTATGIPRRLTERGAGRLGDSPGQLRRLFKLLGIRSRLMRGRAEKRVFPLRAHGLARGHGGAMAEFVRKLARCDHQHGRRDNNHDGACRREFQSDTASRPGKHAIIRAASGRIAMWHPYQPYRSTTPIRTETTRIAQWDNDNTSNRSGAIRTGAETARPKRDATSQHAARCCMPSRRRRPHAPLVPHGAGRRQVRHDMPERLRASMRRANVGGGEAVPACAATACLYTARGQPTYPSPPSQRRITLRQARDI